MTNTDQQQKEDEVLKRMLKTPPKPHKKGRSEDRPDRSRQKDN
tara:strand:+ start:7005 stop:7133 length:129 start_codon:yes stop_codon:yes gene_type:complete